MKKATILLIVMTFLGILIYLLNNSSDKEDESSSEISNSQFNIKKENQGIQKKSLNTKHSNNEMPLVHKNIVKDNKIKRNLAETNNNEKKKIDKISKYKDMNKKEISTKLAKFDKIFSKPNELNDKSPVEISTMFKEYNNLINEYHMRIKSKEIINKRDPEEQKRMEEFKEQVEIISTEPGSPEDKIRQIEAIKEMLLDKDENNNLPQN